MMISFNDLESSVPEKPGIYEIHTRDGIALKVGMAGNLRKRFIQHRSSLQRALQLTAAGGHLNPAGMISKRSILAKHLFFDASLTGDFDLTSEEGRVAFLRERC
jgi:hypothetical protein